MGKKACNMRNNFTNCMNFPMGEENPDKNICAMNEVVRFL